MTYIEGFVIAVPATNRQAFIDHARAADEVFLEYGAGRILECWQQDVPKGKTTDFFGAVDARDDEKVVFSWIEWADKATYDAQLPKLHEAMQTDPRFDMARNPVPFDGKRMIYGSFQPIVERGGHAEGGYVQGFVLPVPDGKQDAYRQMAEDAWEVFHDYGALRVLECWQDNVPEGKQTDFFRAVKAEPGEKVVFSFVEWPSQAVCDAAAEKMQSDERMQPPADQDMPFDPQRMIYGGFVPVVDLSGTPVGD